MVPTIDTVRYSFVTEILLDSQKMVYVTGYGIKLDLLGRGSR